MSKAELVIVVFGAAGGAELYFENVNKLPAETQIPLLDAVIVTKDAFGNTTITETVDVDSTEGAVAGAAAGALVGLLGGPLGVAIGAAAGAVVGGAAADQIDLGVPTQALDVVCERMKARTSAFLTLVDPVYIPALEGVFGTLNQTIQSVFIHHEVNPAALDQAKQKAKSKRS
ncbi:MAG: DUF1269 domain-containing protein [Chloroflexi bacterium]|nr:DUF1269 domain-containing protein [Chloroflexota bacterium]